MITCPSYTSKLFGMKCSLLLQVVPGNALVANGTNTNEDEGDTTLTAWKKLFVIICIFIPGRFCQSDCFLINCLSREDKKLVYTWHVWLFTHMHNTERTFKHFYQYFLWINVTCDLPSFGFAGLDVVFERAVSLDFHPTKDMDLPADLFIFLHFSWVSVFPMDYVRGQAPTYHFTCICIAVPRTFIFLQEAPFRGVGGPPCGVVDDRYDHKDGGGSHIGHSDHQTKSSRF